ncbi:MAG TPA: carboxypeptidase regulatory-like domain-containing protein [Bryobacteraceae bacterium]|nr:carboxypeptidase regulatory-like domain-containing protein [Bryobacteraceae bacterium]
MSLCASNLAAQGTSVIFGTVSDQTGSAVARASVTATNEATGVTTKVMSNEAGYYLFPDLRPGSYKITCQVQGFQTVERTGVILEVDRRARVDLQMQVGEVKQVLEVQGTGTTVDTMTSTVKDVVDSHRMDLLPLNGRNALSLQALLPGAIQMGTGSAATGIALNTNLVFSVNGTRADQSAYILDGGMNMDMYNNVPAAFPNPDTLQEFSMLENNYSAVNGRNAGAVINMVTKSGTNQLHGDLYDFLRNSDMDARNFFSPGVSPLHRNQFGGTVGGPVKLPHYNGHDRTFFFFAYEGTRQTLGTTNSSTVLPSALERQGDFSQSFIRGKAVTVAPPDSVTAQNPTGTPFPGNVIPASRLDPAAMNFIKAFLPLPNSAGNIYTYNYSVPTNDNQVVAKLDHSFSNANKLSARYFWDDSFNIQNTVVPAFNSQNDWVTQNGSLNDTHIFSPNIVNAANLTIARNTFIRAPLVTSPANFAALGCQSCVSLSPPNVPTDWAVSVNNGIGLRVPTNYYSFMMNYQFSDTVSWTVSNHLLQFGGDISKVRRNGQEYFQKDTQFSFNGLASGNYGYGYADFLLGSATSVFQNSPISSWQYKWAPFLFFQDDWRVSHRLTLNLGMRWEPYITIKDRYGENAAFRPGQKSQIYPLAPVGYVFPGDPGISAGVTPNRYDRFSPRVGFAYDPTGDGKTSIRGGYGIFSDTLQLVALNSNPTDQPFSYGLTTFNVQFSNPYLHNPQQLQLLETYQRPTTAQQRATWPFYQPLQVISMNPDFTTAYIQQWNFNVQREVWKKVVVTVGYLGNKGTRLHVNEQINPALYVPGKSSSTNVDARRIYQGYQTIESVQSTANSTYHSLQVNWNRRFENGITFLGSYVWSRALDLASTDGNSGLGNQASDPFNWNRDKGLADFNVKSRFVTSFIWDLPFWKSSKGIQHALLAGWQVNGILTLQTGQPFSVYAGQDRSLAGVGLDHADVLHPVATYNNQSVNSKVAHFFDTSAFALPALGTFGTSGRNILYGPGLQNLDAGLFKTFQVDEQRRFEIRWEIFNSLNRPNFLNPNNSFSSPNFGRILSARDPRILQLAAKFYF